MRILRFWPFGLERRMECPEVRESASYLVDDPDCPPGLMERLLRHLSGCELCTAFVETLRTTVGMVQRMPKEQAPEGFRQRMSGIGRGEE